MSNRPVEYYILNHRDQPVKDLARICKVSQEEVRQIILADEWKKLGEQLNEASEAYDVVTKHHKIHQEELYMDHDTRTLMVR